MVQHCRHAHNELFGDSVQERDCDQHYCCCPSDVQPVRLCSSSLTSEPTWRWDYQILARIITSNVEMLFQFHWDLHTSEISEGLSSWLDGSISRSWLQSSAARNKGHNTNLLGQHSCSSICQRQHWCTWSSAGGKEKEWADKRHILCCAWQYL